MTAPIAALGWIYTSKLSKMSKFALCVIPPISQKRSWSLKTGKL